MGLVLTHSSAVKVDIAKTLRLKRTEFYFLLILQACGDQLGLCCALHHSEKQADSLLNLERCCSWDRMYLFLGNWKVEVIQSCPTLCDPMDYTVHGILQARILKWVAFPFPRGSSQPKDQTQVSHIAGRFFTS